MKKAYRIGDAKFAFIRQNDRLKENIPIRVGILFVPFLLAIVLTLFTGLETNTRLHSIARPIEDTSPLASEHDIWLSIAAKNDHLIVTSPEGDLFSWEVERPDKNSISKFQAYLRNRAEELVKDSVRRGQIDEDRTMVALSVDQNLTYQHLRPVIYSLAQAGFSKYGFETRVIR